MSAKEHRTDNEDYEEGRVQHHPQSSTASGGDTHDPEHIPKAKAKIEKLKTEIFVGINEDKRRDMDKQKTRHEPRSHNEAHDGKKEQSCPHVSPARQDGRDKKRHFQPDDQSPSTIHKKAKIN